MTDPPRAPAAPPRTLAIAALCVAAAIGGAYLAHRLASGPAAAPATVVAAVYDRPRPLPEFSLVLADGTPFDRARLAGRYTFLFFGYTNCPDLCPTTLAELARAERLLADLPPADRPAVVLISVDPGRDTPEVLARYAPHFDPAFRAATGSDAALATLAAALGAAYRRGDPVDGSYAVEHTAALFLVDPAARVAAVFPTPHVAATIAADYRRILAARSRG